MTLTDLVCAAIAGVFVLPFAAMAVFITVSLYRILWEEKRS